MHITMPREITDVAWEGELGAGKISNAFRGPADGRGPICALGRPEVWPAGEVMESHTGQAWTPPVGGARFWLVRLACTLREPPGRPSITGASLELFIRPETPSAGTEAYAYSLLPERVGVEDKREFTIALEPGLKAAKVAEIKVGKCGATMDFTRVFPVIQAYGVGEAQCGWKFLPHRKHPIDGSQFLYAVLAASPKESSVKLNVGLTAEIVSKLGPIRLGVPESAKNDLIFTIPTQGDETCQTYMKAD